jgi:hypothetical protein
MYRLQGTVDLSGQGEPFVLQPRENDNCLELTVFYPQLHINKKRQKG